MVAVSVVIPTYNRAHLVQEAIDSVLAQSFQDLEVIVIDDGSSDGTGQLLHQKYGDRVEYRFQANQGESVARNHGIQLARGRFISFLDSDDRWLPQRLQRHLECFAESESICMVASPAWEIDGSGHRTEHTIPYHPQPNTIELSSLVRANYVTSPTLVTLRRDRLPPEPIFDPAIKYGEDWDLWLRILKNSLGRWINEPLAEIRVHPGGQGEWMPRKGEANRVFDDHMRLLQRLDDTDSAELLGALNFARSNEYAKSAFVHYAVGDPELARERLELAIQLEPSHWSQSGVITGMALNRILHLSRLSSPTEQEKVAEKCAENIFGNLPSVISHYARDKRRILAHAYVDLGQEALSNGHVEFGRRLLFKATRLDIRWLGNRGVMAGLLKPKIGSSND